MDNANSDLSKGFGAAGDKEMFVNIPCIPGSGSYQRWDADPGLQLTGRLVEERERAWEANRGNAGGRVG